VEPEIMEFWVDQKNRLHKRELYKLEENKWNLYLLSP
jgi:pyridoxine/pyridoxamine 5'-phosphate oxidase